MITNEKVLEELAIQFAVDYFSISDVSYTKENIGKIKKEIFKEENADAIVIGSSCNVRNIFVIGAGASYDSYKHIPMAGDAVEKIKTNLRINELQNNPWFNKKLEDNKDRIRRIHKLNPDDFESQLALFTNFITTEDIQGELTKFYKKRWYPSMFYEIVAHLFKHRFIDAIINFNFDELLDQALDEELSHDDYSNIYSDGQCIQLRDALTNGRLKRPIYIKPHGTISHKSSLKFTKEDYFGLSSDMINLLGSLLNGERGQNQLQIDRVNLIVVGSSMKSFDFNNIIKEKLPINSAIYFFSVTPPDLAAFEKEDPEFAKKFVDCYTFPDGSHRFYQLDYSPKMNNKLGDVFQNLYTNKFRKKLFTPIYEPKDIYRHRIITEVFYNDGTRLFETTGTGKKESIYLFARTCLEFVIAIVKAKGKISKDEIMQERFGYYYTRYYEETYGNSPTKTIYDILNFFGVEDGCFINADQKIDYKSKNSVQLVSEMLKKFIHLADTPPFEELRNFADNASKYENVKKWLIKVYEHDSVSIAPRFNYLEFFTYKGATERNIIPTKLALVRKFISAIDKWDLVLVSSNKGKMLLNILAAENEARKNDPNGFYYRNKCCCIVLEDDIYQQPLEDLITKERLIDGQVHILDKKNYGDNIMLFLKRNPTNSPEPWDMAKGIVYHRINGSLKICPYYVQNSEHLVKLKEDFFKTLLGSDTYDEKKVNKLLKEFALKYDTKAPTQG